MTAGKQVSGEIAEVLWQRLITLLTPLLFLLDEAIDKRLVLTFVQSIGAIIKFRHRQQGLLLSELGGILLSPAQAPAGTKRLSNLLRSGKRHYSLIERFLWQQAQARIEGLVVASQAALCLWDQSELEKAESLSLEGLCPIRSSKASRLKRIKPGYFNPPGDHPIFVPGMHWLSLLVVGYQGPTVVAAMRWWTTRGPLATDRRTVEKELLGQCATSWGQGLLHIFDRGFAGAPWLAQLLASQLRFVLRWPHRLHLLDAADSQRAAWRLTCGRRAWVYRQPWDAPRRCWRKVGVCVLAVPARHPSFDHPLWLVVSRPGQGRSPWYLLTNQPVHTPDDAWHLVLAYARRWQIEMAYRYTKSELAMESPRLWSWDNRLKLLLMATLAYAFLLSLLDTSLLLLRNWLIRYWCHRTGKGYRDASIPLYQLRSALSQLWLAFSPPSFPSWQNSG